MSYQQTNGECEMKYQQTDGEYEMTKMSVYRKHSHMELNGKSQSITEYMVNPSGIVPAMNAFSMKDRNPMSSYDEVSGTQLDALTVTLMEGQYGTVNRTITLRELIPS